jgi:hypothetical protein
MQKVKRVSVFQLTISNYKSTINSRSTGNAIRKSSRLPAAGRKNKKQETGNKKWKTGKQESRKTGKLTYLLPQIDTD